MMEGSRATDSHTVEYPKLRNLEFFPVREGETQSVGLRDPQGISKEILFLPPNVFYLIQFLDGQHTRNQIAGEYLKRFGELLLPNWVDKFLAELDEKLFLEGDRFDTTQKALAEAYRKETVRPAAHAGKSYDADPEKLDAQLEEYFKSKEGPGNARSEHAGQRIKAIVAPHVELSMAGPIYAWAYKEIREADIPDVFVILGAARGIIETLFACTEKDFVTPLARYMSIESFCDCCGSMAAKSFSKKKLFTRMITPSSFRPSSFSIAWARRNRLRSFRFSAPSRTCISAIPIWSARGSAYQNSSRPFVKRWRPTISRYASSRVGICRTSV